MTSQFFANLYLNELDYFVKFDMRRRYYLRYMDDFLIFGNDEDELSELRTKIRDFLKNRSALNLHEGKSQIYKTRTGIKFLGFRIYKDYRRLAADNMRRFRKRLKRFAYLFENGKIDANQIRDSVRCWAAHSKYARTGALRLDIWKSLPTGKPDSLSGLLKDVLLDKG